MIALRSYSPTDSEACLRLFRETVRKVNVNDYNPNQIDAWASDEIDLQEWGNRFLNRFAYVAVLDDDLVGFADMTEGGYLDRLFVSADHQRKGSLNNSSQDC